MSTSTSTIRYYLARDGRRKQAGLRVPLSTGTIWKILDRYQRIMRPRDRHHEVLERPEPMQDQEIDFTDIPTIPGLSPAGGDIIKANPYKFIFVVKTHPSQKHRRAK